MCSVARLMPHRLYACGGGGAGGGGVVPHFFSHWFTTFVHIYKVYLVKTFKVLKAARMRIRQTSDKEGNNAFNNRVFFNPMACKFCRICAVHRRNLSFTLRMYSF